VQSEAKGPAKRLVKQESIAFIYEYTNAINRAVNRPTYCVQVFYIFNLTQYGPKNLRIKLLTRCIFGHVSTIGLRNVVEISIILLPVTNHTAPYER